MHLHTHTHAVCVYLGVCRWWGGGGGVRKKGMLARGAFLSVHLADASALGGHVESIRTSMPAGTQPH